MSANEYAFVTHWYMENTRIEEIIDLLSNADDLTRWWPAVYLDVKTLEKGDAQGLNKVVSLYTKGWLPYTLRWNFRVTEITSSGFKITAFGDFEGYGIWTFEQQDTTVYIRYDWVIRAEKPLLKRLSFILKPIFAANHHWAMQKGEESLRLELARRRAPTPEAARKIPAPPQPTPLRIGE